MFYFGTRKNPAIRNLKGYTQVQCDLSGAKLSFLRPVPKKREGQKYHPLTQIDELNFKLNIFDKNILNGEGEYKEIRAFASEIFPFYGLPYLWEIGGIELIIGVAHRNGNFDLFNSNEYEEWIIHDLSRRYAPAKHKRWGSQFPLFWTPIALPQSPNIEWASYANQGFGLTRGESISYEIRTPITQQHELCFTFDIIKTKFDTHAFTTYSNIITKIMESVQLTLAPSEETALNKAKESGAFKLSENRPIELFDEDSASVGYYNELIENPNIAYEEKGITVDRYFLKKAFGQ